MNVIGKTNGGSVIVGMSEATSAVIEKLADSRRSMPSGLVLAELSEKQIEVLRELSGVLKKANKPL
jgi:hypothetical protein